MRLDQRVQAKAFDCFILVFHVRVHHFNITWAAGYQWWRISGNRPKTMVHPCKVGPVVGKASSSALASLRHSCQQENVERQRLFYGEHLHSHSSQQFTAVVHVKDVMMEAAVFEVAKGALTEVIRCTRRWIHFQIVEAQYFLKVRKIVFLRIPGEIFEHMSYWGRCPTMVEGFRVVRQGQN